jgi:hypothetical protein
MGRVRRRACRSAQRQRRLDIAFDHEVAREEEGVAVHLAVDEADQARQRSADAHVDVGRQGAYRRKARPHPLRLEQERERQVARVDAEALSRMRAEPPEDLRMLLLDPVHEQRQQRL